jgi:hypothetical protein
MRKPISTKTHAFLDYITATKLLLLPRMLGFSETVTNAMTAAGLVKLTYTLLTNHEGGVMKVLPMKAHLAMDAVGGASLCALPFATEAGRIRRRGLDADRNRARPGQPRVDPPANRADVGRSVPRTRPGGAGCSGIDRDVVGERAAAYCDGALISACSSKSFFDSDATRAGSAAERSSRSEGSVRRLNTAN